MIFFDFIFLSNEIPSTNGKDEANPFEDEHEDWEDYSNDALVDNGEPGVLVKALYDYDGAEADELSFKQGIFFLLKSIKFLNCSF